MLVVGATEQEDDSVTVRTRGQKEQRRMKVDQFVAAAGEQIAQRCVEVIPSG